MAVVVDILGHDINFDVEELLLVADRSSSEATITCLHGFARGMIQTFDAATDLLSKLGIASTFAQLTRDDGASIWVRASSVSKVQSITAPGWAGINDDGNQKTVLSVGSLKQAVKGTVADTISVLNAHGANL